MLLNHKKNRLIFSGLLLLLGVLWWLPTIASADEEPTPADILQEAWQNATASGQYDYRTLVDQTTYPLPKLSNTSRQPTHNNIAMQGSLNFETNQMALTFWQDGSFDPQTGIQVKVENGRAYSRAGGNNPWQEAGNVANVFAPAGDPLSFLAGMQNVQVGDTRTYDFGTNGAQTYTAYTFDLNGSTFSNHLRREMDAQLRAGGQLPPGMSLSASESYRNMSGYGEVWLDSNLLPVRIVLDVTLPPDRTNGEIKASITTDLSNFKLDNIEMSNATFLGDAQTWLRYNLPTTAETQQIAFNTIALMIVTFLVLLSMSYWRHPRFYAIVVLTLIFSMLVSPILSGRIVHAYYVDQRAEHNEQMADVARQERRQDAFTAVEESDWNPQLAPAAQYTPNQPQLDVASALSSTSADTSTDTDGDGLTDAAEAIHGTCDGTTSDGYCAGIADPTDTDADGLSDGLEVNSIGTNPLSDDSDLDGILDPIEIQGFLYNGITWYLNPNEADTNKDGVGDSLECPAWNISLNDLYDTTAICPDTDSDNVPDLFDNDNDNDGVIDEVDSSPFAVLNQEFSRTTPFNLSIDNLAIDKPVYVDFQILPSDRDNLALYQHVLDWPSGDTLGQIQRRTDSTWADTRTSDLRLDADNAANGDVRIYPVLEIVMPYTTSHYANLPVKQGSLANRLVSNSASTWVDTNALDPFGVNVKQVNDDGTLTAIIPVNVARDSDGNPHAFSARMYYQPSQGDNGRATWGEAHQIRLSWIVEMLSDQCLDRRTNPDDCARYDVLQSINTYYDDWTLTGLNVSEELALETAIIYEDPAQDTDLLYDDQLTAASMNLANTFLRGRDCGYVAGVCTSDGERDINMTNISTTVPAWFTATNYLEVETFDYSHRAELALLASQEASRILSDTFTAYASQTVPTLMFAHEGESRELNLNSLSDPTGDSLTIDLDPTTVQSARRAGISWMPYQYAGGVWQAYEATSYLELYESRLTNLPFFQAADSSEASQYEADTRMLFAQLYYATMIQGAVAVTEMDGLNTWRESDDAPETGYEPDIAPGTLNGISAVTLWFLNPLSIRIIGNWTQPVQQVISGQLYKNFGNFNPLTIVLILAAIAGLSLIIAGMLTDDDRLFRIGELIMASITIVFVLAMIVHYVYVMILVARTAIELGLFTFNMMYYSSRTFSYTGYFGAAITGVITWGLAIWQLAVADDSIARGIIASQAIAQTTLIIVSLILSKLGLGILFFFLVLADAILILFNKRTFTEQIVEQISGIIYNVNMLSNNLDSGTRLEVTIGELELRELELGFTTGNVISATINITNNVGVAGRASIKEIKNQTAFAYLLSDEPINHHDSLKRGDNEDDYVEVYEYVEGFGELIDKMQLTDSAVAVRELDIRKGINQPLDYYLNEAYLVGYKGCWHAAIRLFGGGCDVGHVKGTFHLSLDETLVFDVLPATIGEFASLTWAGGEVNLPVQVDLDGDYLSDLDGTDPDNRTFDTDGDTLTDYYEVSEGLDPTNPDTDSDGLLDGDELRHNTDPRKWDTDGDGLNDKLEAVDGWLISYEDDSGALQFMRVWSNPNAINADDDTFNDYLEFSFGLNPNVATDPSAATNLIQIEDLQLNEVITQSQPVAHYQFEEDVNNTIFADTITESSIATCNAALGECPAAGQAGRFGAGLTFDGNDVITATLPFTLETDNDFSVAVWVKYEEKPSLDIHYLVSNENFDWLTIDYGRLSTNLATGSSSITRLNTPNLIPGQWYHLALVRHASAGTADYYVDGVKVDTLPMRTTTLGGSNNLNLGGWKFRNDKLDGKMDELVVYDYALSASEISDLMTGFIQQDDLIVQSGAELTYQATISDTTNTQNVDGFLSATTEYLTPTVGTPDLYFTFAPEDIVTTFSDTVVGGRYGTTCTAEGHCPTHENSGQINSAIFFNGIDDHLIFPTYSQGIIDDSGQEKQTIAFWIRVNGRPAAGEFDYILDTDETAEGVRPHGAVDLMINSDGRLVFDIGGATEDGLPNHVSSAVLGSGWNHVVINYAVSATNFGFDEGSSEITINNVSDSTAYYDKGASPIELFIGPGRFGSDMNGENRFHGRLDEFVLYNNERLYDGDGTAILDIMGGNYAPADLNPREEAAVLLKFDETASTVPIGVINQMSDGQAGLCNGNNCPTLTSSGYFSEGVDFDGNDYLTIEPFFDPADQAFTALAWVKPTANGVVLAQADGNGTGRTWLGLQGSNQLFTTLGGSTLQSPSGLTLNQWSHVAVSHDGTNITLFVNGVAVNSAAVTTESSDGQLILGADSALANQFSGTMDDFLLFPSALGADGVTALMNHSYPAIVIDEPIIPFTIEKTATIPSNSGDHWAAATAYDLGYEMFANPAATACTGNNCPTILTDSGIGESVSFDGVDDWLEAGQDVFSIGQQVSFWMKVDSPPADDDTIMVGTNKNSPFTTNVHLELTTSGTLRYFYSDETGSPSVTINSTTNVADGEWHHIVFTGRDGVDGSSGYWNKLFVDGQLEASVDTDVLAFQSLDVVIGRENASATSSYFAGEIDEFRFIRYSGRPQITEATAQALAADRPGVAQELPTVSTTVTGTAHVRDIAGNGYHNFQETVDAVVQLQQAIPEPIVDNNLGDLVIFAPFDETPNAELFNNYVSTEADFTCEVGACPQSGFSGVAGNALLFDGLNDRLTGPAPFVSPDFTAAAWVKADRGTIVALNDYETRLDFGGFMVEGIRLPATLPENEWVHLAGTYEYDTKTAKVYINGTLISSANVGNSLRRDIYVGMHEDFGNPLNGYLDDLRLYDATLSDADIATLYQTSAPVLRFEFDEESTETTFADSSANQFVGQPTLTTVQAADGTTGVERNPASGTDGQIGNTALFVDRSNALTVNPSDDSALDLNATTIAMWVRPDGPYASGEQILFSKQASDGTQSNYELALATNSLQLTFNAHQANCTTAITPLTSNSSLVENVWSHVAVTFDGTSARLFINGVQDDSYSSASTTLCQNDHPVEIGTNYSGEMDELALYGRALTASEIQSLYLRELRWYRAIANYEVRVDNEAPTIELISDEPYRQNGYIQLALSVVDLWSEVAFVEMEIERPYTSTINVESAVRCGDVPDGVVWCPVFDTTELDGSGTYSLTFHAIDIAGNKTTSPVYHIYADGTGPAATLNGFTNEWQNLTSEAAEAISYTLPIEATIVDPALPDSTSGSGVLSNTVSIGLYDVNTGELAGNGSWQPMIYQGNDLYTVEYEIRGLRPNGQYSVTITASDAAGNPISSIASDTLSGSNGLQSVTSSVANSVQLDGRASLVSIPPDMVPALSVSGTLQLDGTASELTAFGGQLAMHNFEIITGTGYADTTFWDREITCATGNCPTLNTDMLDQSGLFGQSVYFDGTNDQLELDLNDNISYTFSLTKPFAISMWFRNQGLATADRTLLAMDGGSGTSQSIFGLDTSNQFLTQLGGVTTVVTDTAVSNNTPYHAAVTFDGSTVTLYLNGLSVAQSTTPPQFASGQLYIGSNGSGQYFRGLIDELSVYDLSLTDRQVATLAQSGGRGVSSVEIGYELVTNFNTYSETASINADSWTAASLSGNGNLVRNWSFAESDSNREGFYAIHARATDAAGNVSYPRTLWQGYIDRVPPTIVGEARQIVVDSDPKTTVTFTTTDNILDADSLVHVCTAGDLTSSTYSGLGFPYDGTVYQIVGSCQLDGHLSQVDLTICDSVNNCTTETIISVLADTTLAITAPSNGETIAGGTTANIPVTGNAYVPDGLSEVGLFVNGDLDQTLTISGAPISSDWSFNWQPTVSGVYSLTILITDTLNATTSQSVEIITNQQACEVEYTGDSTTDFTSGDATALQQAVAAATNNSVLKIAGHCFGVTGDGVYTQTFIIDKPLTLAGGYELGGDWSTADADSFETIIDADSRGRVIEINNAGDVTLQDLTISNGYTHFAGNSNIHRNNGSGVNIGASQVVMENVTIRDNSTEHLGSGVYIYDASATVTVNNSDILSNWHPDLRDIRGGGFFVDDNATLTITNSTIADHINGGGGGLYVSGGAQTHIENSTIRNNEGVSFGGAFWMGGSVTVVNSTISNNTSRAGKAGGIEMTAGGVLDISYTTIVSNSESGINPVGTITMSNSVIAYHSVANCKSVIDTDSGYSFDSDDSCGLSAGTSITNSDPLLSPLAENFGTTWTHMPLPNSPLLDVIPNGVNDCGTTVTTDQRGFSRTAYANCDIGSVEIDPIPLIPPTPQLTINASNIDLVWPSTSPVCQYDVYESTNPFSDYTQLSSDQSELTLSDSDTSGDDNDVYYYISAQCVNGTVDSPAVGVFEFGLTSGN